MHSPIPQLMILVTALCLDSFAASFVYGAERVRIPAASVAVLSGRSEEHTSELQSLSC